MNGHTDCVDILVQAGGVSTEGIRSMAAVSIQTAFRGHRWVYLRVHGTLKEDTLDVLL